MRIASWNIMSGMSNPEFAPEIIAGIREIDADVIMLNEGYSTTDMPDEVHELSDEYSVIEAVEYDDPDPDIARPNQDFEIALGYIILSRIDLKLVASRANIPRNQVFMDIVDPESKQNMHAVGIHLDHRYENRRQQTMQEVIETHYPDIMFGDFNAMQPWRWRARLLRALPMDQLMKFVPHEDYRYLGGLFVGMAEGGALAVAESEGYEDVYAGKPKPTIKPHRSLPYWTAAAQIDHMLIRPERLTAANFQRHKLPGSDHLPISADVTVGS